MAHEASSRLEWAKVVLMPLVTVVITVIGGFYFTSISKQREARDAERTRELTTRESNDRLFAQILTQREQSDAQVRKDMFQTVLSNFFSDAKKGALDDKILELELLASNFNQSLDLAPLFKDLARRLTGDASLSGSERKALRKRLDSTAADVIVKQVISLGRRGFVKTITVPLGGWEQRFGKPIFDTTIDSAVLFPGMGSSSAGDKSIRFVIEIIDVSIERREVDVRLLARFDDSEERVDRHFWVGQYDFPMLDNTQLPNGLRASLVLTEFFVPEVERDRESNSWVRLNLVVFPAASASFKERQDYDDILFDKLSAESKRTHRREP
jgi:hypothetical protein